MSKITDTICDIRFNFGYIKPFENNKLELQLEDVIRNNIASFKNVDWIHDSRAYNIANIKKYKIDKQPIKRKLEDIPTLYNYTKNILTEISKITKLDDDLLKYLSEDKNSTNDNTLKKNENEITLKNDIDDASNSDNIDSDTDSNEEDSNDDTKNFINNNETFESEMKFIDTDDLTTYSTESGRLLSYQAVCDLTKNIARSHLTVNMKKDESIAYAEERERLKLKEELKKYMKLSDVNNELESNFNVDIDNMNLKQLQYYSSEAKNIYEKLKITHIMLQGANGIDSIQSTVFKDGIKIPGTKKALKLNNIGGALKTAVFDKKSPLYVAYENLIEKYNWHVSDELLTGLTLLNTIFKNVEIVDVKKKDNTSNSEKDNSDDSDDDSNNDSDDDSNNDSNNDSNDDSDDINK